MYTVYAEVRVAGVVTDVVSLNGQYLDLHGVNRHQDRLNMGWAITKVYSNMDSVRLQVNGTTIGSSGGAGRIFQWTGVALRTGANTVVATGASGTTIAT